MAESQKEVASATKPPKKGSLLDEEMGNDFFGSWKTMSTKGGGDLDFKEAAAPKGKKSAFNFDNLDMDFSLDGDFGKNISSFKVDMDLDFSSPPRKATKSKDQSAKESNLGKQGKQDGFNFSFDFDELDSFDLDSSLTKKDKKCDNPPDDQGFNAPEKHENDQGPKRNLAKSIDAPEDGVSLTCKLDNFDMDSTLTKKEKESDKFSADKISSSPGKQEKIQDPKRDHVRSVDVIEDGDANKPRKEAEHVVTSDVDHLIGSFGKYGSKNIDSPSVSTDLASYSDTKTLPEKEIISSGKETEEYSERSEKTVYTEPNAVEAVQESSNRSVSVDDSTQNAPESQAEVCSSATEVNINPEEKQDFNVKPIAGLDSNPVKSCNMECSPANSQPMGTDNELSKKLENQTDIPMEDVSMDGSVQGDMNIEDASVANTEAKLPSTQPRKENKVVTKLLPTILHSEPKIQKLSALKVKGLDLTHSKPLTQSVETGKQLKTTAVPRKICAVVNKKLEVVHLSPPDARRQEVNPSDAQAGSRKFGSSMSHYKAITTDVPVELGIEKNNNQKFSPSFQAHSASLVEKRTDPKTQKGLNSRLLISSTPSTKNLKSNSIEGNKLSPLETGRKKLDVTSLKALKPVTPKNDFLHSKVGIEMTSLKRTDGNATEHISPLAKMDCAGGVDQQGLSSPSMKRKMLEVPKAYQVTPYPLKRVIESPSGSRDDPEIFEKLDNKRVRSTLNQLDSFRSSPTFDIPRNAYLKELEVPLLVENDGVVEKAEAYAKELENICNMLKKKNEEAKEILVRAVVTNNNLLMLNHPIYEEKIRNIQRLASRMVSMELGT